MARVLFTPFPTETPALRQGLPEDYQRIESTPAMFGGQIGAAEERAGPEITQAGNELTNTYSELTAQQENQNWQSRVRSIMYGDPNVPGDSGLNGKHGQEFLDARAGALAAIDQARQESMGRLRTYQGQIIFNNESRFYQTRLESEIGAKYDQEYRAYGINTQEDGYKGALSESSIHYNDPNALVAQIGNASAAALKKAQLQGLLPMDGHAALSPEQNAFVARTQRDAEAHVAEAAFTSAIGQRDFAHAQTIFDRHKAALSTLPNFDGLANRLRQESISSQATAMAFPGVVPAPSAAPIVDAATVSAAATQAGVDPALANATAALESGHGANVGSGEHAAVRGNVFQMGPTDRAAVGGSAAAMGTPQEQVHDGVAFLAQKRQELQAALGRDPTNSEVYLAHQQGTNGAIALLRAAADPNNAIPAGHIVGDNAIRNNGGNPDAPARQFVDMWQQRYQFAESQYSGGQTPAYPYPSSRLTAIMSSNADPQVKVEAAHLVELQWADQNHAFEAEQHARKQASDEAETKIVSDIYSPQPTMTAQRVATDQTLPLTPEARIRMTALAAAGPYSGASARESERTTSSLLEDMRRPSGDPQRIADMGPIYDARIKSRITNADFDFLQKQFLDMRDPEGGKLSTQVGQFVTGMKSTITRSNALAGLIRPLEDQKFYQFQRNIDDQIAAYRKAGKNPFDLFDPAKPDYLGSPKALQPYMTPMDQAGQELTAQFGGVPAVPSAPAAPTPAAAPNVLPRRPGETMQDWAARMHLGIPGAAAEPARPTLQP